MADHEPGFNHETMDEAMQQYIHSGKLAGVQIMVAHREQIIHKQCFGAQHLYQKKPLVEGTLYRIFSMTKPITSLAVMMLWEEGRFDLQEPVDRFLPAFRHLEVFNPDGDPWPLSRRITFHDLLTHTSGLGYGLDQSSPVERMYARANILNMKEGLAEKMERIATLPLHHQPGERFTYSVATDVLGYLVELISGQPIDLYLKERIFDPLRMTDTNFYLPDGKISRLGPLYTKLKHLPLMDVGLVPNALRPTFLRGAWVNKSRKPAFLSGGGGLVSTLRDYFQFVRMLARQGEFNGNHLISLKTFQTMTTPQLLDHQNPTPGMNIGYGLSLLTDPTIAPLPLSQGSFGGSGAAGTTFWVDPSCDLIGILMMQYVSVQAVDIAAEFTRIAVGNRLSEVDHEPA